MSRMKPTHPGAAINAALQHLYRVTAYAVACPDCGSLAGEPCTPHRMMASRSCMPPVAETCYDPHKARRVAAWKVLDAASKAVIGITCPACGCAVDARFPSSLAHRCPPPGQSEVEAEVSAALAPEGGAR